MTTAVTTTAAAAMNDVDNLPVDNAQACEMQLAGPKQVTTNFLGNKISRITVSSPVRTVQHCRHQEPDVESVLKRWPSMRHLSSPIPDRRLSSGPCTHFSHDKCIRDWHNSTQPERNTCFICRRKLLVANSLTAAQIVGPHHAPGLDEVPIDRGIYMIDLITAMEVRRDIQRVRKSSGNIAERKSPRPRGISTWRLVVCCARSSSHIATSPSLCYISWPFTSHSWTWTMPCLFRIEDSQSPGIGLPECAMPFRKKPSWMSAWTYIGKACLSLIHTKWSQSLQNTYYLSSKRAAG
jgi:hypothetical protein